MSGLIYVPQVSSDGIGRQALPQGGDGALTAAATAKLGQAVEGFGDTLAKVSAAQLGINRETNKAKRETDFLLGVDGLNQKYQNDPDPSSAPQRYQEEVTKLRQTAIDGFDPQTRAEFDLHLQRKSITAVSNQRYDALKRQSDQYTGNLDAQYQLYTNRYAAAKTDEERKAVAGELEQSLQSGVASGMMTHRGAEGYRQALAKTGDEALALRAIGQNPAAAQAAFADSTKFTGLDPVRRQQLMDHAKAAAEEQRAAGIIQQARFNPAAAALASGRLTDPKQAEIVFDQAIIPQESGGKAGAVSVQGALGVSQIMPDTARMVAGKIGRADIAGMDDATLRGRLTSDPKLARELGLAYFQDNLKTFNGNLAPTIASYHAGPGGAVAKAHQQAVAAYGETYSPEQFLSFMPPGLKDGGGKATVDYVRDIFKRMGAPTNAAAMSPMASYRMANAVGQVLDQEAARRDQVTRSLVAVAGREADALSPILRDGYSPDPERVAATRSTLMLGAQRGDAGSAEKLRSFEEALSMAPVVNQMYRMKPEHLEAELASARQQMASGIVTPEISRRVELMEKVSGEIATARKDNPLALIERQGIAPATPVNVGVDMADPGQVGSFRQQLAARSATSDRADALYSSRAFFKPEERLAVKQRYQEMGENDRFRLLKEVAENTSEASYRAAVTEMTGGNGHAATAGMFMRRNPELARAIITGAAYLEQPGVKPKVDDLKKSFSAAFGGDMYPPTLQSQLSDAALAVYAAERGKNGALYDPQDTAGIQSAVDRVIGKLEKINGRRVPVPADLAGWQLKEALYAIDKPHIEAMGGAFDNRGQPFEPSFIRRYAQLKPAGVGDGRYLVVVQQGGDTRPILDKNQQPLIYDAHELVKQVRGAQPSNMQSAQQRRADNILREGARVSGETQ